MTAQSNIMYTTRLTRLPGAATTHGPEYEFKLAALVAMRAFKKGLNFQLFTNVAVARPCDDLVLRLQGPTERVSEPVTFLIQLKHSRDSKIITEQAFINDKGDFAIPKYFEVFKKIVEWHNKGVEGEERYFLQHPWEDVRFVMYTTKDVAMQRGGSDLNSHEDLLFTGSNRENDVFSFTEKQKKVWNLIEGDDRKFYQNSFLKQIRVFSAQSHSDDMDEKIKEEFDEIYPGDVKKLASEFILKFKEWAQSISNDYPITHGFVRDFLEEYVKAELQKNAKEITRGSIVFKKEALEDLRAAVQRSTRLLLVVRGVTAPGLRATKLIQTLETEFPNDWMYVDDDMFKKIRDHEKLKEMVAAVARRVSVIVIDVRNIKEEENIQNLVLPDGKCDKKLLILRGAVTRFRNKNVARKVYEEKWMLKDLREKERSIFLNNIVTFQGQKIPLKELESIWDSINEDVDAEILCALEEKKEPNIGTEITSKTTDNLLSRRLTHYSVVDAHVLTETEPSKDHFVLKDFPREILQKAARQLNISQNIKENDRWTVFTGDYKPTANTTKTTLQEIAEKRKVSVHLLEYISGDNLNDLVTIWRFTMGSDDTMLKYVKADEGCHKSPICKHDNIFALQSFKTALLIGDAGVGKTTTIEQLATHWKETEPSHWVIVIKFLQHISILRKWKDVCDMNDSHLLELMASAVGAVTGAERRCLEASLRCPSAVSVFVDGVDEIAPVHKHTALRLLQLFLNSKAVRRIWVAARPEVEVSLRRTMRKPAFELQPLTKEEQECFLISHWKSSNRAIDDDLESKAKAVVERLSMTAHGLLASPLHLQMAAEVFCEREVHPLDLSLLSLYQQFVERKKTLYWEKSGIDYTYLDNSLNTDEEFYARHEKCAASFLFSDEKFKDETIIKDLTSYVQSNVIDKEKNGILWKDETGNLQFIHQTFAEYFASKWLWKNAPSSRDVTRIVKKIIRNDERDPIKGFLLDLLKEKGFPIHAAICEKEMMTAEHFLNNSMDPNSRDPLLGWSMFEWIKCIYSNWVKGNEEELLENEEDWLENEEEWLENEEEWLENALEHAAHWGCKEMVNLLLQRAPSKQCLSAALQKAARHHSNDHLEVAKALLEYRARDDTSGETSLHVASEYGNVEMVSLLLSHPHDINARDRFRNTALHYVCENSEWIQQHQTLEQQLKAKGGVIDDSLGSALMEEAFKVDCLSCLKEILCRTKDVNSARVYAHSMDHDMLIRCTASAPTQFKLITTSAKTKNEADVNTKASAVNYVLKDVILPKSDIKVIKLLIANGTNVNDKGSLENTPLHRAAYNGNLDAMKLLVENGCKVNEKNYKGETPLHNAAYIDNVDAMKLLIKNGSNVNEKNSYGETLLNKEALNGDVDAMKLLIENGCNVNEKDSIGDTPLHKATLRGNVEAMKLLIEHGSNLNEKDFKVETPLHKATLRSDVKAMKLLIENGSNVNEKDSEGKTPLHKAALKDNIDAMKLLIENRSIVNEKDSKGDTPLHNAAYIRNVDAMELLIANGSIVFERNSYGNTPLHNAVYVGNVDAMKLLIEKGSNVNEKCFKGKTPLHHAALQGNIDSMKILIKNGSNVNEKDSEGETPLHKAAIQGKADVIKLLIEKGSNVNEKNSKGDTPLHNAVYIRNADFMKHLIENGSSVNEKDSGGETPLHKAALIANSYAMKILIENGSNVNEKDYDGETSLHKAALQGNADSMKLLIENGSNVNDKNSKGETPLYNAAYNWNIDAMMLLIEKGSNVNEKNCEGKIPLHNAALKNNVDAMKLLIEKGNNVNEKNSKGDTPLHSAAIEGKIDAVELLIENGCNVNDKNSREETPLHNAALNGSLYTMKLLIQNGCNVNERNSKGETPLFNATYNCNVKAMKLLIEKGSNVKEKNSKGETLLHIAALNGSVYTMKLLIQNGSNVNEKNSKGETPLHNAALEGNVDAMNLLVENGCNVIEKDSKGNTV